VLSTIVWDGLTDPATSRSVPAFEGFYLANERRLFRALYVVTGDRHEAEEIMQTAFVRVWERWDKVARLDDPSGYLFRTAFNAQRSMARRAMRSARNLVENRADLQTPPDPQNVAEDRDWATRLLATLTPRQRQAVVLTALMGFSPTEAAAVMRIQPPTVRVLVNQARTALSLPDQEPEDSPTPEGDGA
jgi:RNA polymerase sigma factor (sigma-70 family)